MDKALILIFFPFFSLLCLLGFIAYYTRGGRPVRLTLSGLGIKFTLDGIPPPGHDQTGVTHAMA